MSESVNSKETPAPSIADPELQKLINESDVRNPRSPSFASIGAWREMFERRIARLTGMCKVFESAEGVAVEAAARKMQLLLNEASDFLELGSAIVLDRSRSVTPKLTGAAYSEASGIYAGPNVVMPATKPFHEDGELKKLDEARREEEKRTAEARASGRWWKSKNRYTLFVHHLRDSLDMNQEATVRKILAETCRQLKRPCPTGKKGWDKGPYRFRELASMFANLLKLPESFLGEEENANLSQLLGQIQLKISEAKIQHKLAGRKLA